MRKMKFVLVLAFTLMGLSHGYANGLDSAATTYVSGYLKKSVANGPGSGVFWSCFAGDCTYSLGNLECKFPANNSVSCSSNTADLTVPAVRLFGALLKRDSANKSSHIAWSCFAGDCSYQIGNLACKWSKVNGIQNVRCKVLEAF